MLLTIAISLYLLVGILVAKELVLDQISADSFVPMIIIGLIIIMFWPIAITGVIMFVVILSTQKI